MSPARPSALAAAMTCSSRARPPTSCNTLDRLLLSRVPLPAAIMATAKPVTSMPAIFSCRMVLAPCNERRIIEAERGAHGDECPDSGQRIPQNKLQPGLRLCGWGSAAEKLGRVRPQRFTGAICKTAFKAGERTVCSGQSGDQGADHANAFSHSRHLRATGPGATRADHPHTSAAVR